MSRVFANPDSVIQEPNGIRMWCECTSEDDSVIGVIERFFRTDDPEYAQAVQAYENFVANQGGS